MSENIRLAFQGIWSHKLRSILTMLGVIIGIASIMTIVSLIEGTNQRLAENLRGRGNNVVYISLKSSGSEYNVTGGYEKLDGLYPVSDEIKERIKNISEVKYATYFLKYNVSEYDQKTVRYNDKDIPCDLLGIDENYFLTMGSIVTEGRAFQSTDFSKIKKVLIINQVARENLFGKEEAVGREIEIKGEIYTIVGVCERSDAFKPKISTYSDYVNYMTQDGPEMYMPKSTFAFPFGFDLPETCAVRAAESEKMQSAGVKAQRALQTGVRSERIYYEAEDFSAAIRQQQEQQEGMSNMLIMVASIALLVGGIGVMNIMLVSVTERTPEIGLKKALGAKKKVIMLQFLTESVVLTTLGGILGILAGIAIASILAYISDMDVVFPLWAILVGFFFSMAVGVVFGAMPAVQAAKLDPIEAIVALMEKIYAQSLLYDFYGELLTEHQRRVYEEVVFDDLSLGEVAEELGISRQGVHDMVRRTEKALRKYEEKLGLVRKFISLKRKVNEIKELTEDEKIRKLAEEILEEL